MFVSPAGNGASDWARPVVPIGHGPDPGIAFTIRGYRFSDAQLSADGWLCYIQHRDPVTLHGQQGIKPGWFRPIITYEVAIEGKTSWRQIRVEKEQLPFDTVTISPENPMINVSIDLEPFQEWIGTYRYGRVLLENGDAAIVALEDLLPTGDACNTGGNFKQDVSQGSGGILKHEFKLPRSNDPAVLSNIISLGGQLIGEFIFAPQTETISLSGTRTLDGDFWPLATLYGGNSVTDWKEIGKPENKGKPGTLEIGIGKAETFRISFSKNKDEISKYKYCKVLFPSGQSLVFYADLLAPKATNCD